MNLETRLLNESDDLESIVADINNAKWDTANEMGAYDFESLRYYVRQADTLFVICYIEHAVGAELAGIASARIQHKPYDKMRWLYIDEVDAAANLRQRGVGTAIMKLLLEYAEANDLEEVWLGTEADNVPARKLYESLKPNYIDDVVGYTFEY